MKSVYRTFAAFTLMLALAFAGCSTATQQAIATSEGDKRMVKMIECMNAIADAVEGGKSDATIDKLQSRFERARKSMASLPASEQTMPATKYAVQMQSAQQRMAQAVIDHGLARMKSMQGYGK